MYLFEIFHANPLAGLALCVCLGTILWCIRLTHRQKNSLDKVLAGLLGLVAIYEALRILSDTGFMIFSGFRRLDSWAEFLIATLYLIAVMMLKISSMDRARTKVQLRLVEANEKSPENGKTTSSLAPDLAYLLFDASPLATFATDTDKIVIYWNPAAEDLLGWKRDEVLGEPLPFALSSPLVCKRGESVDAALWTSPIYSSAGLRRATLVIAASSTVLRRAGLTSTNLNAKPELLLQA